MNSSRYTSTWSRASDCACREKFNHMISYALLVAAASMGASYSMYADKDSSVWGVCVGGVGCQWLSVTYHSPFPLTCKKRRRTSYTPWGWRGGTPPIGHRLPFIL